MSVVSDENAQNTLLVNDESRRLFMQKMIGVFGVATATSIMSGCDLNTAYNHQRLHLPTGDTLLSEHEMTTLFEVCDTILPRTDTPSATELNCHKFVPHQLQHCHSESEQKSCIDILNKIDWLSDQRFKKPYALLADDQQQKLLVDLENGNDFNNADKQHFGFLKALIVFGYFTSEVGATQALNYQAVPGGFIGSIPATPETKSWGSIDYY